MKVLLMHPERDFDVQAPLPPQADTLIQDLALDTLFDAMAGGDDFLRAVARVGLLQSLDDAREITWRQQALDDCDSHRLIIETLYKLALATVENERRQMHFWAHDTSSGNLSEGVETLQRCLAGLHALREIADDQARGSFHSPAFLQFFAALRSQLDDGYLALIAAQLKELHSQHGMMAGARVGSGAKASDGCCTRRQLHRMAAGATGSGMSRRPSRSKSPRATRQVPWHSTRCATARLKSPPPPSRRPPAR